MGSKKKARNKQNPSPKKNAKTALSPTPKKKPINSVDPHAYKNLCPAWRFRFVDGGGKWAITDELLPEIIKDRLKNFETTKWSEIESQMTGGKDRHKKHHSMEISDLPKDARERWKSCNLQYIDTVFRFRFGSKIRVWGIREFNVFKPVWWDPEHTVFPTEPD